jgi:type VI secretion system (T6SS) effector TldE1-like protein
VNAAIARRASPARKALTARSAVATRPAAFPHTPPAQTTSPARKPAPRSRKANTILLTLAAAGLALTVAAWITSPDLSALASASPASAERSSFEDRFVSVPKATTSALLQPLKRLVLAKADFKADFRSDLELSTAADALASRWPQNDLRPAIAGQTPLAPPVATTAPAAIASSVPLPRSRPAAADQPAQTSQAFALATTAEPITTAMATTDTVPNRPERSALQKFSDMMKAKMTVASLGLGRAPDLSALGYDNETAVYDITAHAVYLPNGTVFEAHSGMGNLRDDPDHVNMRMVGATPPAMYSLKPREASFHGVAALRMTPADGSDINGRSGLLVHSFMLGPNGDSNGCVSIRDFDRFRKAYDDGQFTHLAVVPSVKAMILAQAQQSAD